MGREAAYDEVFDGQAHFRALLDSTARPGALNFLTPVQIDPPAGLNRATALIAFALMDGNSNFATVNMTQSEGSYLAANTRARRTEIDGADFIFASGDEAPEFLEAACCGTLLYPDTAATLILQIQDAVVQIQDAPERPLTGGLRLTLKGPGVDGISALFVRGIRADLLLALQARNAEFPLGLDAILTFVDESGRACLAALPRTTHVSWEKC